MAEVKKKTTKNTKKKKEKRKLSNGVAHIISSFNNTIII